MCVRVRLQWQQVHARLRTWKNTKPSMCMHVYLCERLPVNVGIYIADRKFYVTPLGLQKKKKASKREPSLFPCHCWVGRTLPGAPASSWRHTGYQLVCAGAPQHIVPVSQTKGKVGASSYRKLSWQPPFLIKNALTLNAPINLSRLYLARVASCTVYKTQQLKQVILASSRPSRA